MRAAFALAAVLVALAPARLDPTFGSACAVRVDLDGTLDRTPAAYKVKPGRHRFRVQALSGGITGPTKTVGFRVARH